MTRKCLFLQCVIRLGILAATALATTSAQEMKVITNNTPKFVASATNMGPVDPSTIINISVWLKPHNKAALDALAQSLYDRDSPQYRHWLTKKAFVVDYAPTAAEANIVKNFLAANHLSIVTVGPDNFFVRASGTVAAVNSAFHVTLNNYQVNGKTIRANSEDPSVSAEAAPLVNSVSGLDNMEYTHPYVSQLSLRQTLHTPPGASSVTSAVPASSSSLSFSPICFTGTTTETFTTAGGLPKATYTGNEYTNSNTGCGYVPSNIRAAYNLNPLYSKGLDGTGQTIVILDWCGSPTIKQDANAFSSQFGLPKLTASNFNIIYTPTPSQCEAPDPEINIDVEWSHAIAPGAAIDLVVPPSASFQDVDEGFFYAVDYQLGNVISGSYASEELYTPSTVLITEDLISETAAVLGISANFSSGDDGDYTFNLPQYIPASVSAPADSPYATAVGGVSLALTSGNTIAWQSGWGTNENRLSVEGYVADPPSGSGLFNFGSGGGESATFAKPAFQNSLPGTGRQLPDVSWLADPFTGAYIAISEPFTTPELTYQVYGGTSLACPMFSGLWAIANQAAGAPLGQAAPYLYKLPASAITDIVPHSSKTNVTGVVKDSSGITSYSAAELAAPLENSTSFESAIWNVPLYEDEAILITFGTDTGLTTGPGWDNVTGVGVPNGAAFINAFKP